MDCGIVYVVSYLEIPGYYKIGVTYNLIGRIAELEIGSPYHLVVNHQIYTNNPYYIERKLHTWFAAQRVKGEWFALSDKTLMDIKQFRDL